MRTKPENPDQLPPEVLKETPAPADPFKMAPGPSPRSIIADLIAARAESPAAFEKARERAHLSRRQADQILEAFRAGYEAGLRTKLAAAAAEKGGEQNAGDSRPTPDQA